MNHLQRKYYTTVLAVCMLALAVSGCGYGNGNYHQLTAVDRVLTQDNTGISSKHERLDGTEEYTIHVPDGKTYAVLINILHNDWEKWRYSGLYRKRCRKQYVYRVFA